MSATLSMPTVVLNSQKHVTVPMLASRKEVSEVTVHQWCKNGVRVGSKIIKLNASAVVGSRIRFTEADIEKFDAECREAKLGTKAEPATETPTESKQRTKKSKASLDKKLGRTRTKKMASV